MPLIVYLRRRALSRRAWLLVIAGLIVIGLLDRRLQPLGPPDDWRRFHGVSAQVTRVIDGDTLRVAIRDGDSATTAVRLWGIDAPELARPDQSRPADPFAHEAADLLRSLVEGRTVRLTLQRHRIRGGFGRILAYVDTQDGQDVAARLLEAGLVREDSRWSHDRIVAYQALAREARRQGVGLWAP